jgi:hypothetical protein
MSDEHCCEYYVGEDRGDENGECGKPATDTYRFSDGSAMYFCAEHWDEWVKEEQEDLAEFGPDHPLTNDILETLILNGVISKP